MSLESDLDFILADAPGTVELVIGATTRRVPKDSSDELLLERGAAAVVGKMVVLLVKTSDFPAVAVGDAATVDGAAFLVQERLQAGDGATTRLLLRKP